MVISQPNVPAISEAPPLKRSMLHRTMLLALLLTLAHIVMLSLLSGEKEPYRAYMSAGQHWDSNFYLKILVHGYEPLPSAGDEELPSVGFLPGYPLFASLVQSVTNVRPQHALLLAANISAWLFWVYFLLLCRSFGASRFLTALGVAAVFAHPMAFFLGIAYTEPLFLAMLLGTMLWTHSNDSWHWPLTALHAVMLPITRIVGLPLVLYPLVATVCASISASMKPRLLALRSPVIVSAVALSGLLAFFVFCQQKYGIWNIHFSVQGEWFKHVRDYGRIFRPEVYGVHVTNGSLRLAVPSADSLAFSLTLFATLLMATADGAWSLLRQSRRWWLRMSLYLFAFIMLYVSLSGTGRIVHDIYFSRSIIRYVFVVHVLLVLAAVHACAGLRCNRALQLLLIGVLLPLLLSGFLLQMLYAQRFLDSIWVA